MCDTSWRGPCRNDANLPIDQWATLWSQGDPNYDGLTCGDQYHAFVYGGCTGQAGEFIEANWLDTQNDFVTIFQRYIGTGLQLTAPGAPGYNPMQESLETTCQGIPGACDLYLNPFCTPLVPTTVAANAGLLEFCGCYVAQSSPNPLNSKATTPLPPQCDPMCARLTVVPIFDTQNPGQPLLCDRGVCVIDDISVTASMTQIGGGVNFEQVCPACYSEGNTSGCECIVGSIDINSLLGSIGVTDNIEQFCGPNSICFESSSGALDTQVSCSSVAGAGPIASYKFTISPWFIAIVVGVIFLVMIMALAMVYGHRQPKGQWKPPPAKSS